VAKCDYCNTPGKSFTVVGKLPFIKQACKKCKKNAFFLELLEEQRLKDGIRNATAFTPCE
jgi:hypothetical protein